MFGIEKITNSAPLYTYIMIAGPVELTEKLVKMYSRINAC